jgi:plasmid stabilization system protein ParE
MGVRSAAIRPYVVLHRYDRARDTVFILRVLHGRRRRALDAT